MKKIYGLSVQWHITERCTNRCRHCYMFDEKTYRGGQENELDLKGLLAVADSIADFEAKWRASVRDFTLTGGDPLLHPDWVPLVRELKARGKIVNLIGNPETLTAENLSLLGELGVKTFQMSLDGLEDTHDYFRSPGSFQRTLEGIKKLQSAGLRAAIMFTLYPENKDQLLPLLNIAVKDLAVDGFGFDLGVHSGNAASLEKGLQREEVQHLFSRYRAEKEKLKKEGYSTRIGTKNNLFKLLRYQEGGFYPCPVPDVPVLSGCLIGWTSVPILTDGTVLACRRFPLEAGKMPEQSFEEIFLSSPVYRKFRRAQSYTGCGTCGFYQYCRGCPAVTYGLTGDPFGENPLCFKNSITRALPRCTQASPPLDWSREEEYNLVASHFGHLFYHRLNEMTQHPAVRTVLFEILQEDRLRNLYLENPDSCVTHMGADLTDFQKLFIRHFLLHIHPDSDEYSLIYGRLFRAVFH